MDQVGPEPSGQPRQPEGVAYACPHLPDSQQRLRADAVFARLQHGVVEQHYVRLGAGVL